MMDFLYSLYICGSIPLLLILLFAIGKATPSDIIRTTVDFYPIEREWAQLFFRWNLPLTIILGIFGIIFAVFYAIFKPDNLSGFSLLSLAMMFFGVLLTSKQVEKQTEFTQNILEQINLNVDYSNSIKGHSKIEIDLYLSRFFGLIGIELIAIGFVLLCQDYQGLDIRLLQLRYFVVIGIGYGFMNFGWAIERTAINSIIQDQILIRLHQK